MANKTLIGVVVVVVIIAAVAAVLILNDSDDDKDDNEVLHSYSDLALMVYGNVNNDFTIDNEDKALLQDILDGKADASDYPFADVNYDGKVDSNDMTVLESLINRDPQTVHVACYDKNGDSTVVDVQYPLDHIALHGVNIILAALYTNAGSKVATYGSFPVTYPHAYNALGGVSYGSTTSVGVDWTVFTSVDQQTKIDCMFIDNQYKAFLSDTQYDSMDLAGIPYMVFKPSSPNSATSASVTIGFLCGSETEKVGYQLGTSTQQVLSYIANKVGGLSDSQKTSFIMLTRYTSIAQNHHPNYDIGTLAGGIPYWQINSDFASKYPGDSASSTAKDALAEYKDAGAYMSVTSNDFGKTKDSVALDFFGQRSASGSTLDFYYGVLDKVCLINNQLPGAVKVAYAAEMLYPDQFSGYGDQVAQRFIDEGYSPLSGQTPDSLVGMITYEDYQNAVKTITG